jgi:hypothetical protein
MPNFEKLYTGEKKGQDFSPGPSMKYWFVRAGLLGLPAKFLSLVEQIFVVLLLADAAANFFIVLK